MKKVIVYLLFICFFLSLGNSVAYACWELLSVDDLEDQSDLIVIGEYKGHMKEILDDGGFGYRSWTIVVDYVVKGESLQTLDVITGGSSNAKIMVSTDYKLTDYASEYMLLYLVKDQMGRYVPLTPRGIVSLDL
ncbi:MAG: hypothetical protein H7X94_09025, partial [Vallitaleaceae bacterium]|nr:hypothetical protein [Vallitaleaceae bacterium]